MLSGHADVAQVAEHKWDSDPFTMVEKDGKLYGCGAWDMKGFLAVDLAFTPTFELQNIKPIHVAFSHDEELGCVGIHTLIKDMKNSFHADICLAGNGSLNVDTGSKVTAVRV
ncbi:hypothetical protein GH5_01544 [Leishmania sp. Ghana 2012 LV757]|uniref:hypothetical protein n=1 Tax=Leishmania sp. Ghana 2012 LV757 TaxID=2803181 RepID=UPI001B532EC5|nr:hypothetical protein GH5_01544 [Leishmania sp. Ghana 2012 LV757]